MAARMRGYRGGLFYGKKGSPIEPKEALVSKAIEEWLDAHRIYNDRLNSGQIGVGKHWIKLCKKGTPDRFFIMGGKIYFIEVKRRGGTPASDQIDRQEELRKAGAHTFNVDSIDDFIAQFKEYFQLVK